MDARASEKLHARARRGLTLKAGRRPYNAAHPAKSRARASRGGHASECEGACPRCGDTRGSAGARTRVIGTPEAQQGVIQRLAKDDQNTIINVIDAFIRDTKTKKAYAS